MKMAMNVPYIKQYNDEGIVINPIKNNYPQEFDNRSKRRESKTKTPFFGNGNNTPLTVTKNSKYLRQRQIIHCRDKKNGKLTGEIRTIEHYIIK